MDTEVPYVRGKSVDAGGSYAPDEGVLCSQSSMLALIGSGALQTSKNPRTNKITALLASLASMDKQLEIALQSSNALQGEMDSGTHTLIFGEVQEIGRANYIFFDSLVQARNADPAFDHPIAQLLSSALAAIKRAYTAYCTGLGTKLRMLKEALAKNPQYREKIGHPDKLLMAVEAPYLQAQRYPHFIKAIMAATNTDTRPGAQEDSENIPPVHRGFEALQAEAMEAAKRTITAEDLNRSLEQQSDQNTPATTAAPLLAQTASQPTGAPKDVTITKKNAKQSLGLSMESTPNGVYITAVAPGKLAERSNELVAGMLILKINGKKTSSLSEEKRKKMIVGSEKIVFNVQYDPIGHEAARCALQKWYHGIKSEQEAGVYVNGMKDGTFIGCQRAENPRQFALYVAVNKKAQQFTVTREPDGIFFLDGLSGFDVPEFKSFTQVVEHVYPGPCPDFEVALTMFLPPGYVPGIGLGGRVERGRGGGRGRGGRGRGGGQGRGGG